MTTIDAGTLAAPEEARPQPRALMRLVRNKGALFGAALILFFIICAVFAPWLTPYDPIRASFSAVRKAPSAAHWFGTDDIGRDVLARTLFGARASLLAGITSVTIAVCVGAPLGIIAGYRGGWTDAIISRATEALLAVPFLILAIALAAFLGPSLTNAMIAIGIAATPIFIRLARAQAINVKAEDYVESARAIGLPDFWIILRYIAPNSQTPILVQATLTIAQAIIVEASLAFLGLGQQPPSPSWGSMLNTAKNFVSNSPWMSIYPGAAIFLTVLGFNLFGDGLRDALDPKDS